MVDPADPQDEENHSGGWYELDLEYETCDEACVHAALGELRDWP